MEKKASFRLLILFLVFSLVFSRNLKEIGLKEDGGLPVSQDMDNTQGLMKGLFAEEGQEESSSFIEGRMDFERNDYSGTGANNHHDPKPPGSV